MREKITLPNSNDSRRLSEIPKSIPKYTRDVERVSND